MLPFAQTQVKRIFRAPNYVRAFGFWEGLRLLFSVERSLPSVSNELRSVRGPGFPAPVTLRRRVSDHSIFWQCLVMRQYDLSHFRQTEQLMRQYRAILDQGRTPVIIDAGGNIGLAAFWFAMRFPEAAVISVEPDSGNFSGLERNLAVFGTRAIAVRGAVTQTSQAMAIINPDAGSTEFQLRAASDQDADSIAGFTVDSLAGRVPNAELFIVKIDIEGGQKTLFAGNTEWID